MLIQVSSNFDLSALSVDRLNQIWLHNSLRELQSIARRNSPVDTGKLKQGILIEGKYEGNDPNSVRLWQNKARVGPAQIPYAVRREFENYKNPQRKFYMKRTHDVAGPIVQKEFDNAFQIVSKKIQKWAT